jgi:phage portal protein BeeE
MPGGGLKWKEQTMSDAIARAMGRANASYETCKQTVRASGGGGMLSGGGVIPQGPTSLSSAAEQYRHNSGWVQVAVSAIARRLAGQPCYVGRVSTVAKPGRKLSLPGWLKGSGERIEPLSTHPLLAALDDPNPLLVRWSLMFSTVASLELTGAAFWWLSSDPSGKLEIWPLPTHWVEAADNLRQTWLVRPPNTAKPFPVAGDDMVFFSLPDPADPFSVSSPLQAQALSVTTDEAIGQAQYRSFRNGIFPSAVITVGRLEGMDGSKGERPILSNPQRRQLVNTLRQFHRGTLNYGEPLILDGMIEDVKPFSWKPAEMDFTASGKQTKSRIMQAFGVNPLICGEIEGANRAQAVVAEETFCQNVINPLAELFSQTVTGWLGQAESGKSLVFWLEPARAHDPEQTLREWELGLRFGAVELNEYRVRVLNLPEQSQFAVALQPGSMIPAGESNDGDTDADASSQAAE